MGGKGSGGHGRLSDAEKKARGTFRADKSDAVLDARAQARVFVGPWLDRIPEPEIPFITDTGRDKYNELTRLLFDQNKLTAILRTWAEVAAHAFEEIAIIKGERKRPSASLFTQFNRAMEALQIADSAPVITNPEGKRNKFEGAGFASRLFKKTPLRRA
jgi:hypothetical protein